MAVGIDPWKCSGCLECSRSAAPARWSSAQQDPALLNSLQPRFEFLSKTPNTPARFYESATSRDGETKRLILDRGNYYATTGGHGACRGCGEVTAIRLVVAANRAMHEGRRREHIRELESLVERLNAKLAVRCRWTSRSEARRAHRARPCRRSRSGCNCSRAARPATARRAR